jgi:hypothetical protein
MSLPAHAWRVISLCEAAGTWFPFGNNDSKGAGLKLSHFFRRWVIIAMYCEGNTIPLLGDTFVAFRVLEPYAVKVASTVLRRERRGNPPDLSDQDRQYIS